MESFFNGFLVGAGFYTVNYLIKNLFGKNNIIYRYLGLNYEIKYSAILDKNEEIVTYDILTTLPDNSLSSLLLLDEEYNEYHFLIKKKNSYFILYNCEENSKCRFKISLSENDIKIKNTTEEETILCISLKHIN